MSVNDIAAASCHLGVVSSGSLSLDIALGVGGFPRGQIVEIYGPESSGKTTLALRAIANAQGKGELAAFIDAEHALDVNYARKLGVDLDQLLISRPDTGEQVFAIVDMLVRSEAVDLIVIDSVAALVPAGEAESQIGSYRGQHTQLVSQTLNQLMRSIRGSKAAVIFINQIRIKPDARSGSSQEVTTGGASIGLHASVRLDIRRVGSIVKGKEVIGDQTRVKVVKNEMAQPCREAEFDILYATGVNHEGDLIDQGMKYGIVEKSDGCFRYSEKTLGESRERAREFLTRNPRIGNRIDKEVREIAGDLDDKMRMESAAMQQGKSRQSSPTA